NQNEAWRTEPCGLQNPVRGSLTISCPTFGAHFTEHLDGSGRKQVLAVVQMLEIAQLLVDQALNRECPVA
ncbi:DUF6124 family protein, partial [Pseudomonas gelidaquae]|uniref:DUF6124 family protein n=1 Tax=Pseudomonas sp. IB20 TaxID=1702250 RepID=UPI0035326940